MSWADVLQNLASLGRKIITLNDLFAHQQKELDEHKAAIADLRKENAKLSERVAVLEEARKTTAAEVKAALTETIGVWENRKLREEIETLKRAQLLPKSD